MALPKGQLLKKREENQKHKDIKKLLPGCPDFAFSTISAAKTRIVLMHCVSMFISFFSDAAMNEDSQKTSNGTM